MAPGLVDTDMGQRLIKAVQGVEDIRSLDQSVSLVAFVSRKMLPTWLGFL